MARRRALILSHSYYVRDTRFRRHAEAFASAGWDVDVLCARDAGETARERVGSVRVYRLPARRRRGSKARYLFEYAAFGALAAMAITVLHSRRRYDFVYVFSIPNALVFAAAVPRLTRVPVILDVRDPMPEFFQSKYHLAPEHPWVRAMLTEERLACKWASRVVTVSGVMRDLLLRTGLSRDRITVVMNAPDTRLFTAPAGSLRDPNDRTLLFAGTVAYRYGVDLLVRAVGMLKDEIPALRAQIVGDGDAVPGLRKLAGELGVGERVEFTGGVPLDAVPGYIARAWIGAQPHRDDPLMRYCFSTKVLEWCTLGLPVICGRTPAFLEAFDEGELMYVDPANLDDFCAQIRKADANPEGLSERASKAKGAAARFSWEEQRQRLLTAVAAVG
ncbi:MAG: glycosyltransferase family 4 protein [Actinomycetota bacterium]